MNPRFDYDLEVENSDDVSTVKARLKQPADFCYALFCDVERVSEWLWVAGTSVVSRRDERGRGVEVDFMGSLKRASVAYRLTYEYDDELREVRWRNSSGSVKELRGTARFTPLEGGSGCLMSYQLRAELAENLPSWEDEFYSRRPAEAVVIDFCDWVETQWCKREGA